MKEVTDASFHEEVIKPETTVLVDFWSPYCWPCKTLLASLEELQYPGLEVMKVNVDENPAVSQAYGIRGVPTMLLFRNGVPIAAKVGAETAEKIKDWVDEKL